MDSKQCRLQAIKEQLLHTIEDQLNFIIGEMYEEHRKDSDPEVEDILFIRKCVNDYMVGKGVKEAIKVYFDRHWK